MEMACSDTEYWRWSFQRHLGGGGGFQRQLGGGGGSRDSVAKVGVQRQLGGGAVFRVAAWWRWGGGQSLEVMGGWWRVDGGAGWMMEMEVEVEGGRWMVS